MPLKLGRFVRVDTSLLPIALTLMFGAGLSGLATFSVARWEQANYRLQFQRQTDNLATSLQRSINRYTDILLALGDFYRVSQNTVSREDFDRFVERNLVDNPGIQALEWAPVVLEGDRPTFETTQQQNGYPAFRITERDSRGALIPAQERSHYVPVTFIRPWEGNELALGYDLTSDLTRRIALETARDKGEVAASGRIRLVQENKNQFGFLVFLPLYTSPSPPQTLDSRRQALTGYLLGVFRVADVVEESLRTLNYDIDFVLFDQTAIGDEQFLGLYDAATQTLSAEMTQPPSRHQTLCPTPEDCHHPLTTGGRRWAIAFTPGANYPAQPVWGTLSTLLIGALLTLLATRYLAQAQAKLERTRELSELKIRLFSMASHELRTPLSTILISAQSLESGAFSMTPDSAGTVEVGGMEAQSTFGVSHHQTSSGERGDRQRIYSRIRAAAKRMNQLLNDLLTLSRAEAGKLQYAPEILNLPSLCQQWIEEVQVSVEHPPAIEFIPTGDCTMAYVDPHLVRAIVTNLLSNAVKYSQPNPHITLTLAGTPYAIVFIVKDNGIGIPEADQAHLEEAFYRGTNVGEISGTGLGLSVVHACLKLHRGTLQCESAVGQGTTFTVSLPRVE
ncbi:MAG: CHASE domain-containing protein [Leptolyngbyaceae bacterium]|nr:CHASE domain-containing protein [Leptolyngbyaceae bacterium]